MILYVKYVMKIRLICYIQFNNHILLQYSMIKCLGKQKSLEIINIIDLYMKYTELSIGITNQIFFYDFLNRLHFLLSLENLLIKFFLWFLYTWIILLNAHLQIYFIGTKCLIFKVSVITKPKHLKLKALLPLSLN